MYEKLQQKAMICERNNTFNFYLNVVYIFINASLYIFKNQQF